MKTKKITQFLSDLFKFYEILTFKEFTINDLN